MNQQLVCELNLALIPNPELASRHISFSTEMASRYPPVNQLNGVTPRVMGWSGNLSNSTPNALVDPVLRGAGRLTRAVTAAFEPEHPAMGDLAP